MMRSIRLRISSAVFAVVLGLLTVQMTAVLVRVESDLRLQLDAALHEEISELKPWLGRPELQAIIDDEAQHRKSLDEVFFEIRDSEGRLVAASKNVPDAGLPGVGKKMGNEPVRMREAVHPGSRSGHRRIRIAETWVDPYHVQVALALTREQKSYYALREELFYSLALITIIGAVSAYLVANRALKPIRRITARALELGALPEGKLPQTGSGDEIDELAAVLNELLERIRGEVLQTRRMTADVGHALRTPLTVIRGNLELHVNQASNGDVEYLGGVLEEVDQLIRLVNQLLFLEKLAGSENSPMDFHRFDVGLLAQELVEHLSVIAEEKGIELRCSVEPAQVYGDASQIRQALLNVLENAFRHTPSGGYTVLRIHTADATVRISISDSGPGLHTEDLERVFERFYSAPAGSGTGLGLPIARAIARRHGGDLRALALDDTHFVLELPLARSD
jgi:signal transduction histidine kinase